MKKTQMIICIIHLLVVLMMAAIFKSAAQAAEKIELSSGQTVYVSIYTHIYSGLKGRPFDLAATLSIRNTNSKYPIIESIMIGTKSGQGISFVSRGQVIEDYTE